MIESGKDYVLTSSGVSGTPEPPIPSWIFIGADIVYICPTGKWRNGIGQVCFSGPQFMHTYCVTDIVYWYERAFVQLKQFGESRWTVFRSRRQLQWAPVQTLNLDDEIVANVDADINYKRARPKVDITA